ncbi:YdcH family protein [Henriciella aquimarina]|uniref:YdcH family protein n=1 Tax=Henriciella aquimarina TaxID=545261 RepID=UPI0009FD3043|nr:DUF465 domain-containing protein [Henriciella aquimarina]
MSHTPHELAEEFPDAVERMQALKEADPHFARLADQYHEVNREIHRIETDIEPASDEHQTELRKKRLYLKDQIGAMLTTEA